MACKNGEGMEYMITHILENIHRVPLSSGPDKAFMRKILLCILFAFLMISCKAEKMVETSDRIMPTQTGETIISTPYIPDIPVPPQVVLEIKDGGLISGEPCEAPCFLGIIPGETSFDKVPILLKEQQLYNYCIQLDFAHHTLFCGSSFGISFDPVSKLVDSLSFIPNNDIYLMALIEKYGQPNWVMVFPPLNPQVPEIDVRVLFDVSQMEVQLPLEKGDDSYFISALSKCVDVTYLDNSGYLQVKTGSVTQAWTGYGKYLVDDDF
jgi:hypothetical protein